MIVFASGVDYREYFLLFFIGFYHEQSRPERDRYIEVLFRNMKSGTF